MVQPWQILFINVWPLIAAIISLLIAILAWQNRDEPGGYSLTSLMLAITLWSICETLINSVTKLGDKIFLSQIQLIGIVCTPVLFLIFASRYSLLDKWLSRRNILLLWLIPAITLIIVASNKFQGLYWKGFTLDPNTNFVTYIYGPWFWIFTSFAYVCLICATLILIKFTLHVQVFFRKQIWIVILAVAIPWIANILYLLGFIPIEGFDPTPLAFSISGLLLSLSILELRMKDLSPVALGKLVDTLEDALIVVDNRKRVVDLNPAALAMLNASLNEILRKPATDVLSRWPYLTNWLSKPLVSPTDLNLISDINNRYYNTSIYPLSDYRGRRTGNLVVLRDVTEKREIEAEHARLATVVEQAYESIVITDLDGKIKYANPAFERITGYLIEDALGQNFNILKSGVHSKEFFDDLWETISKGDTWTGTFVNLRKGGSEYHEATTIFPIKDKDGSIINYATVKRDITAQIEAEATIKYYTDQLRALNEISIDLSLIENFDDFCRKAVLFGKEKLGFDHLSLQFIDRLDSNFIVGSYRIDEAGALRDERGQRNLIDDNQIHRQFLESNERFLHVHDVPMRNDRLEIIGTREIAIVGLWDRGNIVGFLSTENVASGKPFSNYSLDLLVLFAQSIGNLYTRIKVTEEIRRNARQQELLNEITRIAIEQSDFQKMLQTIADRLGELFQADGCFITLWDEERQLIQPGAAFGPYRDLYTSTHGVRPEKGEATITEAALTLGRVIVVEDIFNTPLLSKRLAKEYPASSILCLPLVAHEQKLGGALISFAEPHLFSKDEIQLGEQAATQIALAILKTRLLNQAEVRAREAETLRHASAAVAATLKRDDAIEQILEELSRVVPYDSASVQLLIGNELEIVGERGFVDSASILGMRFPINADNPNSRVFEAGKPIIIEDAPRLYKAFKSFPHNHIRGWMGVPLKVHDNMIGMLALDSLQPGQFTDDHRRMAMAFADQVAIALENSRLFEETQWLATHDSLTGIINRRHFISLGWKEFQRAKRYHTNLSVIMLDIDHFKRVNDAYGHTIGDQVLQFIANLCRNNLRINDLLGRYGGEEFVILLPETAALTHKGSILDQPCSPEPAKVVAERLRTSIEESVMTTDRGKINITISLGIAELAPSSPDIEYLIDCADQALMQAKNRGRNRVVIWQDEVNIQEISHN